MGRMQARLKALIHNCKSFLIVSFRFCVGRMQATVGRGTQSLYKTVVELAGFHYAFPLSHMLYVTSGGIFSD